MLLHFMARGIIVALPTVIILKNNPFVQEIRTQGGCDMKRELLDSG
jgi:hypothetical protein